MKRIIILLLIISISLTSIAQYNDMRAKRVIAGTISVLPLGNIKMGTAGRISTKGIDTIKITQSSNDTTGAAIAARKIIFYNNGLPTEISQVYIYAPQGDFMALHSPGQINIEAPHIAQNQLLDWNIGAAAPLTFMGSGNSTNPTFIDLYNVDTCNLNNNIGIGFSTYRNATVKTRLARIAGIITDTSAHSPDGELQFFTLKDSILAERVRIMGNGQLRLLSYGAGAFTGTPTKILAVGALGNVIEIAPAEPYLVYTALIRQSGTNVPVADELRNTTGVTFTWSRTGPGLYTLTADSGNPFTADKTVIFLTLGATTAKFDSHDVIWVYNGENMTDTAIDFQTEYRDGASGDDILKRATIEIRIYP